jgi:hypothetical protein
VAGLPWFKQQVDLRRDPRSLILGDILGDSRAWTYVVEMRMYLAENAPTGCVSGLHADIAFERGSGWTGERGRLLNALRDAGFVRAAPAREGGGMEIEDIDWAREQGAHVAKFQRDAKKPDGRSHKVVNPSREDEGSRAAPAELPRGESRELRVESREEDLFPGIAPAQPAPAKKAKEAKKREPTGDPRHGPLSAALVGLGWPHHGGRTAKALKELLALADQSPATAGDKAQAEILRRAAKAKASTGFPQVREIHELATHWGHFAAPSSQASALPKADDPEWVTV